MKILLTLHNCTPEPMFGAERICLQQIRSLIRAGHTVGLFYACNGKISSETLAAEGLSGLHLFPNSYVRTKAQVLLSAWKPHVAARFRRVIRAFRPDVVLFHHLVRLSLDLPSVARQEGVRTAMYLHDYYSVCPSYSLFNAARSICHDASPADCVRCLYESRFGRKIPGALVPVLTPFMRLRERMADRLVDDIDLFISPSTSLLFELGKRGFHMRRSTVIPHGIDKAATSAPYSPHKPVRFGYIGNINRKKGIEVMVKAFQGDLSKLLTIRGFADTGAIEQFKKDNPSCAARLEQFHKDTVDFYTEVDVLVVPSIWLENQPTVLLEAFAHGKPVICSRLGGMEELVKDGRGGLLFQPGDADGLGQIVRRLASNPSELSALAASIPRLPTSDEYTRAVMNAIEGLRL